MKKICLLLLIALGLAVQHISAQAQCPTTVQVAPPATITCQNPTVQLQATVTSPNGMYNLYWYGPVQDPYIPNPVVSTPGAYAVFVFDSLNNCYSADTVEVVQDGSIPQVFIAVGPIPCDAQNDPVSLTATVGGGSGNLAYQWSTTAATPGIEVTAPGTYCVTVSDLSSGCSASTCFTMTLPPPIVLNTYYLEGFCGDSSLIQAVVQGGIPPIQYQWSNGSTYSTVFDPLPGTYEITVTDSRGCAQSTAVVVENDPNECAHLQGQVLADWNTNCTKEPTDVGLQGIRVRVQNAQGNEFFAWTDTDGSYSVELYPGTYTVSVIPPNNLWESCLPAASVTLGPNQVLTRDYLLKPLASCPAMTVDLGNPWLRRCFNGYYWVNYCNEGTVDATNAYIEIQFDPYLTPTSSAIPFTDLGNNKYRFDLGTVAFNTCHNFFINVNVSCNATLGQTHCTEAVIYPTGSCEPANAQWTGASLQISGACQNDSLDFEIRNVGFGTMAEPLNYVIIEDAVMFMQAPPPNIQLAPGAAHHVKVPANGATWRVEARQEPFHPGHSMPSLSVEGCTTNGQFTTGFVNQFSADDNDPWVDVDCTPNVGSYDPNDKQGFPIGYKSAHYIERGTDIEYMIRFQNTGTDTAFTVVIRDELSPWLDPATVVPGASSHPYRFEYYNDRDIKFTFNQINLPDSSVSQAASQGFVSFRISQKANVPLETNIENKAGIFFDANVPVYTNTTVHRVGHNFIVLSSWQPVVPGLELQVMPNPVAESAILELHGLSAGQEWQAEICDAMGRPVRQAQLNGAQWVFERGDLPAGVYFLRLSTHGQVLGAGKLMLK